MAPSPKMAWRTTLVVAILFLLTGLVFAGVGFTSHRVAYYALATTFFCVSVFMSVRASRLKRAARAGGAA